MSSVIFVFILFLFSRFRPTSDLIYNLWGFNFGQRQAELFIFPLGLFLGLFLFFSLFFSLFSLLGIICRSCGLFGLFSWTFFLLHFFGFNFLFHITDFSLWSLLLCTFFLTEHFSHDVLRLLFLLFFNLQFVITFVRGHLSRRLLFNFRHSRCSFFVL